MKGFSYIFPVVILPHEAALTPTSHQSSFHLTIVLCHTQYLVPYSCRVGVFIEELLFNTSFRGQPWCNG